MPAPQKSPPIRQGLLLVGHGSREAMSIAEFLDTARLVAERAAPWDVEPCHLEFASPTIAEGFRALAARGVQRIVVAPVLLFAAGHARCDIPAAVAEVARDYPDIAVEQCSHLGSHPAILKLSKLRYEQATGSEPQFAPEATTLVLVGRGSHDAQATAEMLEFVALRGACDTASQIRVGFMAMAAPALEEVLAEAAASAPHRIVVQPHLLFGGVLLDRLGEIVARYASRHPQSRWIVTRHLGPDDLLAQALVDRAGAAQGS